MRKKIYLALIERLKSAKIGVNHISLWNDNLTSLETESGYRFPAVFVEFDPIQWKQGGQGSKTATIRVRLHIVTETIADASDGSRYQSDALDIFDFIDKVVSTVTGLSGDGFNRFQHIETISDHNHDEIQHDVEVFTCEISDLSASIRRLSLKVENVEISESK